VNCKKNQDGGDPHAAERGQAAGQAARKGASTGRQTRQAR
jgi:hypothetical protein